MIGIRIFSLGLLAAASLTVAAIGTPAAALASDIAHIEASSADFEPDLGGYAFDNPAGEDVVLADFTPGTEEPENLRGTGSLSGETSSVGSRNGAADDFKAGPGCSVQCITSGIAYARGVNAEVVVQTDTAATIVIFVWDDNGYVRSAASGPGQHTFSVLFDGMESGGHYYAAAIATDGAGYSSQAEGSFETLTRNVQISFTTAQIISSPLGNNAFFMDVWINGGWSEGASAAGLHPVGDTLGLGINFTTLEDADRYLDLAIQLMQEADDIPCEVSQFAEPSIGNYACYWAYATIADGDHDLDERPSGATSWTEHSLQRTLQLPGAGALPAGYGEPLNFSIPVSLHVTYE